jgi:hypothetical protein
MGDQHDRSRERRLRSAAARKGLVLRKSRRRDPRAEDFGMFFLIDPEINGQLCEGSLEIVERELERISSR